MWCHMWHLCRINDIYIKEASFRLMHTSVFVDWSIHQNHHVLRCVCESQHQLDTQIGSITKAINPSLDHSWSTHSPGLYRAASTSPSIRPASHLILKNAVFYSTSALVSRKARTVWTASLQPVCADFTSEVWVWGAAHSDIHGFYIYIYSISRYESQEMVKELTVMWVKKMLHFSCYWPETKQWIIFHWHNY